MLRLRDYNDDCDDHGANPRLGPYGVAVVVEHGVATVIIGAGPAELATAAVLAKAGPPVTVLEKAGQVGGAVRPGQPRVWRRP